MFENCFKTMKDISKTIEFKGHQANQNEGLSILEIIKVTMVKVAPANLHLISRSSLHIFAAYTTSGATWKHS
jgi:hypothetical protein